MIFVEFKKHNNFLFCKKKNFKIKKFITGGSDENDFIKDVICELLDYNKTDHLITLKKVE